MAIIAIAAQVMNADIGDNQPEIMSDCHTETPVSTDRFIARTQYRTEILRITIPSAMNAPRDYMIGKRLIESGKTADPAVVANPHSDLKDLMRA